MRRVLFLLCLSTTFTSCNKMPWHKKARNQSKVEITYDEYGFDEQGNHKETKSEFDPQGFNKEGKHENGTCFDDSHQTREGSFYRDGYDYEGYDFLGYDSEGYNKKGFNILNIHRNGTRFDENGLAYHGEKFYSGYDVNGYNQNGFDINGFDREGYNHRGFNAQHLHRNGTYFDDNYGFTYDYSTHYEGYDRNGYNYSGYNREGFNQHGFDRNGFDQTGFNRNGYNREGFNQAGFNRNGYNREGFNQAGFDRNGYNREGFNQAGRNQFGFDRDGNNLNGTRYDNSGYDHAGYDQNGFDRNGFNTNGFNRNGFDQDGYSLDGYNMEGYGRDGYNQQGFDRRGYSRGGFNLQGFHRNGTRFNEQGESAAGDRVDSLGFDSYGFDIRGLDTEAAKLHRNEKAKELMAYLANIGFGLFDNIMQEELEHNLDNLREGLDAHVGRGLRELPSDKEIFNDLFQTKKHLEQWAPLNTSLQNDISLSHVDEKLKKEQRVLDYEELYQSLNISQDFYLELYQALNHNAFLREVEFPDETDDYLNSDHDRKRDYLILFLGSIKNQNNNEQLTRTISTNVWGYATNGNSSSWFAEMRYKLFKIYEKISDLSSDDKKTLLSHFIHAGKHCSDAKKDQIETALGLFNPEAKADLEIREQALATNLEERMESTAAIEKAKILSGRIDAAYEKALNGNLHIVNGNFSADYIRTEGITFKAATWDFYAPKLGLKKKGTMYGSMRFIISDEELFGPGAYTSNTLIDRIRSANGKEILDTYLGCMQHVVNYQDKVYRAVLIEKEFLK
ncbi:MAG: hypothetical protein AB8G05_17055 [Oligoflexales bacterium]